MQKKLLAVAVAGALAVPVIAAAQSSVTISGRVTWEYGFGDQGGNRPSVDYADTPGGSNIRFAGQEALGGGMTAWFQCETSADIRGMDQIGLCSRNSAVGFRGGFGNVYFGRWDTPFKRVMNHGTVGGEETGLLGTSFLGFGGSGGAATSGQNTGNNNNELLGESPQRQRWKRRENCITTYDSPNFGGFQVMGAFTCGNAAADNAATDANTNAKPRTWSIGGQYVNGPLAIGAGYEKHQDMGTGALGGPTSPPVQDMDDHGYGVGISYGFLNGNVLVGFNWLRRNWETGTIGVVSNTETKKDTYGIGVDWRLAGPHQLQFQYQWAGDSKGNGGTIGGNGGAVGCGVAVNGTIGCGDTGADQISIAYQYHLSKRTTFKLGYTKVDNDARSNSVRIGNTAALLTTAGGGSLGQNVDAWAFLIKHNF
jgi:predicted porin